MSVPLPLPELSPAQVEVLCLIAEGFETPDIAQKLGIKEVTVYYHRSQVARRLKTANVALLTRAAMRAGLVD